MVAIRSLFSTGRKAFYQRIENTLAEIKASGTFKNERVISSPQNGNIKVVNGRQVVNFCSNNYLGLCNDPTIKKASIEAIEHYGAGLGSVRFICGTQSLHKELENAISLFHGTEDTILYSSCFDANAGVFEALFGPDDLIISDSLNHASIIDGIRLSKATRKRYDHANMEQLETILKETEVPGTRIFVTDGVFSMDGNIAKLDKICSLADKYGALVFVDDCHATGFIGKTGRGTPELYGLQDHIDILNSTLGKALGGASGGYTTGKSSLVTLLRQKSRPYLFSNTLAPAIAASAMQALKIVDERPELRAKLNDNVKRFRSKMSGNGFKLLGHPDHPIAPVMVGDAALASKLADDLLTDGIYVIGFSYPVVPKGLARIRVQVSAAHTTDQIDHAVAAFTKHAKLRGLLP